MDGINGFFGSKTRKMHANKLCDSLLLECQTLQTCFFN